MEEWANFQLVGGLQLIFLVGKTLKDVKYMEFLSYVFLNCQVNIKIYSYTILDLKVEYNSLFW